MLIPVKYTDAAKEEWKATLIGLVVSQPFFNPKTDRVVPAETKGVITIDWSDEIMAVKLSSLHTESGWAFE